MLVGFCGVSAGENILAEPLLFVRLAGTVVFITGEKEKLGAAGVCPAEALCGWEAVFVDVQQDFEEFFFCCFVLLP